MSDGQNETVESHTQEIGQEAARELLAALRITVTFLANRVEGTFEIDDILEACNDVIAKARATQ